jgi:methionyl-tRNA formyltransferase
MRVIFMGSPAFSVPTLEALVRAGYEIVGVITQPDKPAGRGLAITAPPVKQAALALGLPVFQPESLRDRAFLASLAATRPDLILVAAYGKYIPQEALALAPCGSLNLHPSLLPRWRGACPANAAILAGDAETGATIHFVVDQMDAGDVLAQLSVTIAPDETAASLMARLAPLGAELFVATLRGWLHGEIAPQVQDHGQATWCDRLKKAQGCIEWPRPAEALARQVAAYHPWPGAYTIWQGRTLKILAAHALQEWAGRALPGQVLHLDEGIAVATGAGALILDRVQRAGKRPLPAPDFVLGAPGFVGSVLG